MAVVCEASVFTRLNTEWQWVCAQDRNAQQVRWLLEAAVPEVAEAPRSLGALLEWLQERSLREGRGFSDVWLDALLRHATGDGGGAQLASRVVVQAMLPAAKRMAKRSVRADERLDDVAQVVVAALVQTVRSYPVHRSPVQVARHLRLEMWHHTSRDLAREFGPSEAELDEQLVAEPTAQCDPALRAEEVWLERAAFEAGLEGDLEGARREMVELLVWALGQKVLCRGGVAAIADHYREGAPGDREAAQVVGMSPAAFRQKRSRAAAKLRAAAGEWAAAT
ncbi:hypothetical protein [Streptomyces formicae]|uniref:Sigma-70 family RNA polymerase sigma factor n=1 Tax=Streptomyces formicae TaxID=1616117 RepID=A0ABY3WJP4_9ACTN|nr:hypothetical protein [Streptomyces formicae]UNM11831.1 hypothetical protein J4032_09995 [Streptomyces formicae]